MKYVLGFVLSFCLFAVSAFAAAESDESTVYTVKRIERIAPVFAGLPVRGQLQEHKGFYFVAFYDPDRQLTLGKRKADANDWEFVKLDEFVAFDAHNHAVFEFDRDDCIHLAANIHGSPLNYWRSSRPLDIASMERLDRMTGSKEEQATYPGFLHNPDGALLFQYRSGVSGQGTRLMNIYDETTQTWKRAEADTADKDAGLLDGAPKSNAYPSGPALGPDGWYHMAWLWRDLFLFRTSHDAGYARSKDLKTWVDSRGRKLKLPITPENYECVASVPIMSGFGGTGIGFDSQHRVIISYAAFDRDGNTQYFAERLEDNGWKHYRVTDWNQRFDTNGGGSLYFPFSCSALKPKSDGTLFVRVVNEAVFGDRTAYEYTVDEATLRMIAGPVRVYPKTLTDPPAANVPVTANLMGPPERMLRWFSRPAGHDGDEAFAAEAPKDIWLEIVELEENKNIEPVPYTPAHDRDATWNKVIGAIDPERAPELAEANRLYAEGDTKAAYREFRAYWRKRVQEVLADPDITPRWEDWPGAPSPRIVSDYRNHRYEFNGLRRTLPYNVEYWWPFQPGVLEQWYGLSHTTNSTAPITFTELEQVSPLARWFNDLNRLKHLAALGVSYAATRDEETARYWAHDFYDWLYDNPVPGTTQDIGPWALDVAADRFCDTLMPALYQFVDSKDIRDEEFFGLVRSIAEHSQYFVHALDTPGATSFEKEEAAEMLHWFGSIFKEFNHAKPLADKAIGLIVSFGER